MLGSPHHDELRDDRALFSLTRAIAAEVFGDGKLYPHDKFRSDIVERFGDAAYPHRIHMADLPRDAGLLHNVINNMSGFFLQERYFFMPGFPEMSHPMVNEALERFYPSAPKMYRQTLIAQTSENTLIEAMNRLDPSVDFSSLPMMNSGRASVEISVASEDAELCESSFQLFLQMLEMKAIEYEIIKNNS